MSVSPAFSSATAYLRPVQALTVLYCLAHRETLLSHEADRDRDVDRSPKAWERIRAAALEGQAEDIPIAHETLEAWELGEVLRDAGLDDCAEHLPSALCAVEIVWNECSDDDVPEEALGAALAVAAVRRERLLAEYRPPSPEVPSIWHEVDQGCARRDARERVRVLLRIDRALSLSLDPWTTARVELGRAMKFEAKGEYERARDSLDAAVRRTWHFRNLDRREPAAVALAEHQWRCGEVDTAKRLLSQLRGEHALQLARVIEEKAAERSALADAERVHGERASVESLSALTLAHLSAGHGVAAQRLARELCTEYPDEALAWETRARMLYATARYRSALDPAAKWTDRAPGSAPARSLLARVFARLGTTGREPAGSIAAAAIEYCEAGQVLPVEETLELAEICYRAQFVDWARRADNLLWSGRVESEPDAEWLVAAALRRCHGTWADDAPEWVARLAVRGSHSLEWWGEERVDSLQHWCDLIDCQVRAPAPWRRLKTELTPPARAIVRDACDLAIRAGARDVALRAARDLGYSEECASSTLAATSADLDTEPAGLPDTASDSTARWNRHRATIEGAFGPRIAVALRASEVAQQAWTVLLNDRPNGASLVIRKIFQDEKLAWARWAENRPALEFGATDDPARKRLGLLRELARYTDDEIRRTEWSTRWDDLDRW